MGNRGYGHYERRGYGNYSYPGGYAERERSSPPSAGATSSSEPIPPSYRPGTNTRRFNSVTFKTRTAHGVIREETVQEPDGTMYTEYTFPDGHVERDYW